jgi:hypothetical protein
MLYEGIIQKASMRYNWINDLHKKGIISWLKIWQKKREIKQMKM